MEKQTNLTILLVKQAINTAVLWKAQTDKAVSAWNIVKKKNPRVTEIGRKGP